MIIKNIKVEIKKSTKGLEDKVETISQKEHKGKEIEIRKERFLKLENQFRKSLFK